METESITLKIANTTIPAKAAGAIFKYLREGATVCATSSSGKALTVMVATTEKATAYFRPTGERLLTEVTTFSNEDEHGRRMVGYRFDYTLLPA